MTKTPDLAAALNRAAGGSAPAATAAADRKVLQVRLDPAVHRTAAGAGR